MPLLLLLLFVYFSSIVCIRLLLLLNIEFFLCLVREQLCASIFWIAFNLKFEFFSHSIISAPFREIIQKTLMTTWKIWKRTKNKRERERERRHTRTHTRAHQIEDDENNEIIIKRQQKKRSTHWHWYSHNVSFAFTVYYNNYNISIITLDGVRVHLFVAVLYSIALWSNLSIVVLFWIVVSQLDG